MPLRCMPTGSHPLCSFLLPPHVLAEPHEQVSQLPELLVCWAHLQRRQLLQPPDPKSDHEDGCVHCAVELLPCLWEWCQWSLAHLPLLMMSMMMTSSAARSRQLVLFQMWW